MVNLLFAGDYYPVNEIFEYHKTHNNPKEIFGDLLPLLDKSDIAAYNQEYPLTESDLPIQKFGPNLKGNPDCIRALAEAGFTLGCLANNHSYDFGEQGMLDNISVLKAKNIDFTGVGRSLEEAKKIYYKEIKGIKIAIINVAENEFNTATNYHGGANPLDLIENVYQIREAKENANFVFMVIHGGTDFCHYPSPRMVKQYRFYAEQGVSGILAHHTHHVSGYEIHGGVPIFYSLGNLIYPYKWNPDCLETVIVRFFLEKGKPAQFEYVPMRFNPDLMRLNNLSKDESEGFQRRFEYYSRAILDPDLLEKLWKEHLFKIKNRTVYWTLLATKPYLFYRLVKKFGLFKIYETILLRSKNRFLPLWNLVRCETHRDAVLVHFEKLFIDNSDTNDKAF